ncbi:U6 snRNA phosphodiesterase 1 isoform X3 [Athalia rosae]|uniref:U6 snRNA phosphodiesterase 1 isoform X3 n=1 Tax=Athalia rosae TaxID=37344 RepID=UPI0020347F5F|nr:U6 snRNA phosphodiesterase 1 isoform X3 [Athalia rosae]
MSGLNLIQSYSSESDDIENEEEPIAKNPSEKLPIPQSILSWKGTKHHETVLDDPSKHDGRSRSFKHERGNWATLVYVEQLDNLLSEYQLPPFYQEASFHVSILWCLGDAEEKLNRELPLLNESVSNFLAEQLSHKYLEISNINCKIGNKLYIFPLG